MVPMFFEPADHDFGEQSGGNWTGAIGYVIRKQAEFAIGQIVYSPARLHAVSLMHFFALVAWNYWNM